MARVCVIGAGAGGLAVAARLAAKRHDVTILERSGRAGGKLHTHREDGFAFDIGPSLFTLPAVYRDLFLKTGRPLEQEIDLQETEPGFRYTFADGSRLGLPGSSVGRTSAAIGAAWGPTAEQEWRAAMARAARIWSLTRDSVLGSTIEGPRQLAALARGRGSLRAVAPWLSLHRMARRTFSDPRLVQITDRYATYSGSLPQRAPGALITIPFVEQTFGLWHIGGGLGHLADALERRCRNVGVVIEFGTEVAAIEHDSSGVTAVRTGNGHRIETDLVVSDIDGARLDELLDPGPTRTAVSGPRSYSGFALLLAVAGRSADLAHHNVWFPADYAREFRDLRSGRPVRDPAVYVCCPDDPAMAPAGSEAWFVLVNAPRHGTGSADTTDWHEPGLADSYADHVLAVLASRGCDVRDRIRWRIIRTPARLGEVDGSGDGAIYGSAQHGALSVLRRPRNVDAIPGLFRVGGSAHPGGGLPLVGMSAEIVAGIIGR